MVRKVAVEPPADPFAGKTWRLYELRPRAEAETRRPTSMITLAIDTPAERAAGKGGCNNWFATAKVRGLALELTGMGATMMACPPPAMDEERAFLEAIGRTQAYGVEDRLAHARPIRRRRHALSRADRLRSSGGAEVKEKAMSTGVLVAIAIALLPAVAVAEPVDLELVLAADASGSIDDGEIQLQRQGYAAALSSREIQAAIRVGHLGKIAVTYVEWGDQNSAGRRGALADDRRAGERGGLRGRGPCPAAARIWPQRDRQRNSIMRSARSAPTVGAGCRWHWRAIGLSPPE